MHKSYFYRFHHIYLILRCNMSLRWFILKFWNSDKTEGARYCAKSKKIIWHQKLCTLMIDEVFKFLFLSIDSLFKNFNSVYSWLYTCLLRACLGISNIFFEITFCFHFSKIIHQNLISCEIHVEHHIFQECSWLFLEALLCANKKL